jgi:hypothetical protein
MVVSTVNGGTIYDEITDVQSVVGKFLQLGPIGSLSEILLENCRND